ncbi:S9 family peptidase [Prolixibacteraceae bacterium JC049]|nr:S9 family peptidase [Prolixibacteraceae bacterium JC049]
MRKLLMITFAGLIALTGCESKKEIAMPTVAQKPKKLEAHGEVRVDNYYWLNERENPEVIDYLKAENKYKDDMMAHTEGLQKKLFDEIKGRIVQEDQSVPALNNGYYYYSRTIPETEYYLVCRKKGSLEAEESVMLDVNELAKGYAYYAIGGASVSPNNKMVAFGQDTVSRRNYTIRFKDLDTGKYLADEIPNTEGGCVWANDNKTIFYTVRNETTLRSEKVMKHVLGTPVEKDEVVFFEEDETFNVYVYKTRSKKFIVIGSDATLTSESRVVSADKPNDKFRIVQPRERGLEYSVDHYNGDFYIRTNLNAQNFKLVKTPENKTEKENWKDVIAHRSDIFIQGFEIFKDYLVVSEREEGIKKMRVYQWKDMKAYTIDFGETVYSSWFGANNEANTSVLRVGYTSMTTPSTTYDFDLKTKEFKLLKQTKVLGGFNAADYEAKRVYAEARDGVKVPISIVYKKGVEPNGKNPLLLYGYGSYGATIDPGFSLSRLSLLNRGFVYAIAHIRGSQTYGRPWYEDGKLLKKKNTFTDFIDCGKFLVKEGWTTNEKLFAMGGSAGGLLMGAIINMEPDMWKGVVAQVPFVDVVTTMLDESIPLTTGEFDEWGNPKDKKYYDYMLSYSPYDNVEAKNYPAMLVTTGLHDSQVQYFEPAKWVAKLRELKTDKNPLLFHINMDYGHGGASGRFQWINETALEYAFMMDLVGINE